VLKFSDFDEEAVTLPDDIVIVEWSEEEWLKLLNYERAELEEEDELAEDELAERKSKKYKAKNTQQRRKTQRNKDRMKFQNRQGKLRDKIERKKGGNKVRRLKVRKKWMKKNKAQIKNAQRVYGGKVQSKFTKTAPQHKRGGR
jgi:hypothetical protein